MVRSNREQLAQRIVQRYTNIPKFIKNTTVNNFLIENIPRQTIYSIIGDKSRTGRPRKTRDSNNNRIQKFRYSLNSCDVSTLTNHSQLYP
ncbi:unnamed protein product [Adineta ricciae]|uniref:Uncharacterized protein n=1 Tax=Adineta ricciae TaxID=249248 RepID=A0A814LVS8_ADIRI|nr:unnamed protein product [Adineta ricciae]CAF1507630.1 unnamed protein product [Adineta ricciae]